MTGRGLAVVLGVAAVALLAQVSIALCKGRITSVTLNLPDVKTCAVETITVKGTGQCCGDWSVHYGDGGAVIALSQKACLTFLSTFHYAYSKMGTYTVSAEAATFPGSTCMGKASATVQVAAGPRITSMFALGFFFSFDATPGGLIILQGENFGDLQGQVVIHLTNWKGKSVDVPLENLKWGDTFAAGTVPAVSAVLNQQATVTVVAQCGAVSNAWPVQFAAAPDFADLAYSTPMNSWGFYCSMSTGVTDHDQCQDQGGSNFPPECAQNFPGWGLGPLNNLAGYHDSGWGIPLFSHGLDGTDQYSLNGDLQNGWVLESTSAEVTGQVSAAGQSSGGTVSVNNSLTSAPGTSSPKLGVDYHVNNCGAIFYQGHMIVTGPVGVPF